jgi:hypothetical protein
VPSHDPAVELENLRLQHMQLGAESGHTGARDLGHPLITSVSRDLEKLLRPLASDRRHDAELGKMRPDRVDHGSLLANEQMARAMEHQAALPLGRQLCCSGGSSAARASWLERTACSAW